MSEAIVHVQDLGVEVRTVRGPRSVVTGVDFAAQAGEALGIVGESGSGKTLSVMAIAGLLPREARQVAGGIRLRGDVLDDLPATVRRERTRASVGVVFQNPTTALNHRLTIGTHLAEALSAEHRADRQARQRRQRELLDLAQVSSPERVLRAYPHELSGGLNQRVGIALALARDPALLIADEATTALDVRTAQRILDTIDEIRRDRGLAVILVSHDIGMIAERTQDLVVLRAGRVVEAGRTATLLRTTQNTTTRSLIAAQPTHLPRPAESPGAASEEPLLRVHALQRSFGTRRHPEPALRGVDLQIRPGESVGVVGESGSGKSTLARIVAGLDRADGGEVWFDGHRVTGDHAAARRSWRQEVQFVFQDPYASLDPRLTVGQSIAEPLRHARPRASAREIRERVSALLAEVQLEESFAERLPHSLSGGQRQRVSIARALATRPRLLIADEPVSALDVTVQAQILELISRLVRERGTTLLFVSHDLSVVEYLCERVVVVQRGEVVEEGQTREVLSRPQHSYTRELVDAIPATVPLPAVPVTPRRNLS